MPTMLTARLHQFGAPLSLDRVPVPEPGPTDVLVAVKACSIVPNLRNVLSTDWPALFPHLVRPALPASFGLDAAGIVAAIGSQVLGARPGDRVYVNPGRGCGTCRPCRAGAIADCRSFTFQGYFGRGALSQRIFEHYPCGGLGEYLTAPQSALVPLPASVPFEAAARFGYLGTGYSALKKATVGPASSVLINAIGGTLGLGTALLALAMGATRILGTGRNPALLERVRALAPGRIAVLSVADGRPIADWAMQLTGGAGVDAVIDALPPRAPAAASLDALMALGQGGRAVDIGAMAEPLVLPPYWLKATKATLTGSSWFSTEDGAEMAEMARAGTLDLSVFEHRRFPLARVNEAIAGLADGAGGFVNSVVLP